MLIHNYICIIYCSMYLYICRERKREREREREKICVHIRIYTYIYIHINIRTMQVYIYITHIIHLCIHILHDVCIYIYKYSIYINALSSSHSLTNHTWDHTQAIHPQPYHNSALGSQTFTKSKHTAQFGSMFHTNTDGISIL